MSIQLLKMTSLVMVCFITLQACMDFRPRVGAPWQQKLLSQGPKNASTSFQEGWRDGCETGISATANSFQRHFYGFKKNPDRISDQVYYTGWKTAFAYCSRYTAQYLRRQYL